MGARLEDMMAQLETYARTTREQLGNNPEQASYWRGVLFGLELAMLEVGKQPAAPDSAPSLSDEFYESVNKLVFEHLENLITLCQASIKRDLLIYNAKVIRYELLKAIHRQAGSRPASDYEWQANPDRE